MVVGSRVENTGQVRLYRDLREWHDEGIFAEADEGKGFMWECPDFFPGKKRVLMFSPQGMAAEGYHYRNLFQSGYLPGDWQPGVNRSPTADNLLSWTTPRLYAPQSFLTRMADALSSGGWICKESSMPEQQDGWAGMLSLPRELSLVDGRVRMKPAAEVTALRGEAIIPRPSAV